MAMPNPNNTFTHLPKFASSVPPPFPTSSSLHNLLKVKPHPPPPSLALPPLPLPHPHPRLFSFPPSSRPSFFRNRRFSLFSFPQDSSKPSDDANVNDGHLQVEEDEGAEESQREEAWKQTLASFKDQALMLQAVSQEAYDVYSRKAIVILKETSEKLKIQADKARQDLTAIAKEIAQESQEYLANAADKYPEPVKDIVETFASSADELNQVSQVRDFYIGIPYGALLSAGGFLSFMITGSLSAIRFGVILGGALLALSISSLRSWKKGEPFSLALNGQAAISAVLFLRDLRILFSRPFIFNFITSFVSGAVVVFYAYRIVVDAAKGKGSSMEGETES